MTEHDQAGATPAVSLSQRVAAAFQRLKPQDEEAPDPGRDGEEEEAGAAGPSPEPDDPEDEDEGSGDGEEPETDDDEEEEEGDLDKADPKSLAKKVRKQERQIKNLRERLRPAEAIFEDLGSDDPAKKARAWEFLSKTFGMKAPPATDDEPEGDPFGDLREKYSETDLELLEDAVKIAESRLSGKAGPDALAKALGIDPSDLKEIVEERRSSREERAYKDKVASDIGRIRARVQKTHPDAQVTTETVLEAVKAHPALKDSPEDAVVLHLAKRGKPKADKTPPKGMRPGPKGTESRGRPMPPKTDIKAQVARRFEAYQDL